MIRVRRSILLSCSFALAGVGYDQTGAYAQTPEATRPKRVVHRFDFDERADGNLESVPKYWDPLRPAGFPEFAVGTFDPQIGRLAPPSFHLASSGRNVAYQYSGPATQVRQDTDYRIEGYIRPDRLIHARACLSAYFLDKHGHPLLETLVRTPYVGGDGESDQWTAVELYLPSAPPNALTIGLTAWVLQQATWDTSVRTRRHIDHTEVQAGAWFDDIAVFKLPRVELTTTVRGNALPADSSSRLLIHIADHEYASLHGNITITDADGRRIREVPIAVTRETMRKPIAIDLDDLPPGYYTGHLDVLANDTLIVSRKQSFVRLAPLLGSDDGLARPFGIVIDPQERSDPVTELALLRNHAARAVKFPIWPEQTPTTPSLAHRQETERTLQELVKDGFALTGVLVAPPAEIARRYGAYTRSVVDLLSDEPSAWREYLAGAAAPFATTFRWWQIGADGTSSAGSPVEFATAAAQLRDALRPFILLPRLGAPARSLDEPASLDLPVEQITLTLGSELQPDAYADAIGRLRAFDYDQIAVYVPPLPQDQYARLARIVDWSRRLIRARYAGADVVFTAQPWHVRETDYGIVTEPTEEFIILRTIADIIADGQPGPSLNIADGVRCLVFHRGNESVLALWDDLAPPEGRDHAIQLGKATRQIDLWGNTTPLARDEHGRQIVHLTESPTFVDGVERWLIDFRTSLTLSPDVVDSGTERVHFTIESNYAGRVSVSGQGLLDAPSAWGIAPHRFPINVIPGQANAIEFTLKYSHREPSGKKTIIAKLNVEPGPYYMEVPLTTDLRLSGLDVQGMAIMEGSDLILRHILSNRTETSVNFRSSAAVPGRERQNKPFTSVLPGQMQTVEYRFREANDLIGRDILLSLREMNDGPRVHNLQLTVP